MRIRFTIYKHSILATIISIFSMLFLIIGVMLLFVEPSSEFSGIGEKIFVVLIFVAMGIGGNILAGKINENKKFSKWKKNIEKSGADLLISASVKDAVAAYNNCKGEKALEYIKTLNPQAGMIIDEELNKEVKIKK